MRGLQSEACTFERRVGSQTRDSMRAPWAGLKVSSAVFVIYKYITHFGVVSIPTEGLYELCRADLVPVALLNMSDWRAAEAAVSDPPCASSCLQKDTCHAVACCHSPTVLLLLQPLKDVRLMLANQSVWL